MIRILVHAGFYKTGTTSLQACLSHNRAALSPWFDFCGPGDLRGTGRLAHLYAARPFPWRRTRFRHSLRAGLARLPAPPSGHLVISRESFTGLLPGHRDWRGRPVLGFPHAATLTQIVAAELSRRFGRSAQIEFLLTTRARESWLASLHGHLLRSIDMTDDLATFTARFPADLDPKREATRLAHALAPLPVHIADLETMAARREGPAAAVLDLMNVPKDARTTLSLPTRTNQGQTETQRAAFLTLNRSGLSRTALKKAKEDLLSPISAGFPPRPPAFD
ncbi:hypothetical protein U5922_017410 [Aquicoccus sp. G2-2]|uniref:hypothetical protein n=1 Tax=Aquicoccus sp. G2-2 TaxID=3092120 RepID=UPI002AE0300E|nr:hypothetical protein [Aquicoccus sp. G2-2]MEA1115159.1 hypothetical protein [Aquicoccus sp. G2-2]